MSGFDPQAIVQEARQLEVPDDLGDQLKERIAVIIGELVIKDAVSVGHDRWGRQNGGHSEMIVVLRPSDAEEAKGKRLLVGIDRGATTEGKRLDLMVNAVLFDQDISPDPTLQMGRIALASILAEKGSTYAPIEVTRLAQYGMPGSPGNRLSKEGKHYDALDSRFRSGTFDPFHTANNNDRRRGQGLPGYTETNQVLGDMLALLTDYIVDTTLTENYAKTQPMRISYSPQRWHPA